MDALNPTVSTGQASKKVRLCEREEDPPPPTLIIHTQLCSYSAVVSQQTTLDVQRWQRRPHSIRQDQSSVSSRVELPGTRFATLTVYEPLEVTTTTSLTTPSSPLPTNRNTHKRNYVRVNPKNPASFKATQVKKVSFHAKLGKPPLSALTTTFTPHKEGLTTKFQRRTPHHPNLRDPFWSLFGFFGSTYGPSSLGPSPSGSIPSHIDPSAHHSSPTQPIPEPHGPINTCPR
ncbi:hypothetical protein K2173_013297 [Erythroxylum novogranatense]|uniref:Uncharacterized protein n=1 Tax=Erythroxylum novogranatense TaxID=1862640 RepID=A0AAV8S9I2_9ROSI|nr:hypothetical protein K2173_013297 [Erythroxylum novogranatense]